MRERGSLGIRMSLLHTNLCCCARDSVRAYALDLSKSGRSLMCLYCNNSASLIRCSCCIRRG
ncbi:hypothetical protein XAC3810_210019 [Xanthomonas citri pv. citri]|uniref:Uncharacterized protein n=1 Tax=Xanthomonas citri pv. citri TaxID=611301 RepID=A0A0U5FA27_XANCI|nr:hypothetical protein XAC9322_190018 [Xanthomonas citri pv. citri]CEE19315.1 hypothetical protein XAC3824_180019 [Xanthomonas citri pv. citri]CEE20341.1 hypothetical protein XAC1083_190019 [Xanthomonas citri pv. citri]CEE28595.1 hypothetical protein XAC3810_210019 [Xanthomonas citri pv. citri]CEE30561.1 hypothetical protein XAC902_220009 [Xanthomonas citri pv. citri]